MTTTTVAAEQCTPPPLVGDRGDLYQSLVRQIARRCAADESRVIGVTSCTHGEGATTVATNLAKSAARSDPSRVLLIDGNTEHPALHHEFSTPGAKGWRHLLTGDSSVEDAIQATQWKNLSLITGGTEVPATASVNPIAVAHVLEQLRESFEWVIVDLPPANPTTSCFSVAQALGSLLLVLEAEGVRGPVARRVCEQFQRDGVNLVGIVLNKRRSHIPNWLYRRL